MENTTLILVIYIVGALISSVLGYISLLFYIPPVKRDEGKTISVVIITGILSWIFVTIAIISLITAGITFLGATLMAKLFTKISDQLPKESSTESKVNNLKKSQSLDPPLEEEDDPNEEDDYDEGGLKQPLERKISGNIN